jgi:hypothetical protein
MSDDLKQLAEALMDSALGAPGAPADPRPLYRPALRFLREREPSGFERAVGYFAETLLPAIADGADPVGAWLDYGRFLAGAMGVGRQLEVDETGRARPVDDVVAARGLLLFVPDSPEAPVLVLRQPNPGSPAQRATVELLVVGRVTASAYD